MTERLIWKTAQIRAVATVAKELDVTIELKVDGSLIFHPRPIDQQAAYRPKGGVRF